MQNQPKLIKSYTEQEYANHIRENFCLMAHEFAQVNPEILKQLDPMAYTEILMAVDTLYTALKKAA